MNYLPPQRPQSPPYGPLQRRLLGLAGFLAALMIALIVFHALHTGSTGLNAVAEAAERTARQPGAKLALEVTYTVETAAGPKTVVGNGSGVYNARTGRTEGTLTVPLPGKGPLTIDTVGDDEHIFLRSSAFDAELPAGKEWLGMEPFLGHSTDTALSSNGSARSQLEILKTMGGGTEELDQQTVRGHLTTRYKGSVEMAKVAQFFAEEGKGELAQEFEKVAEQIPAPIPVEVWVDDKGLVRQTRMIEPLPTTSGGPAVTMDMRIQLFAFGAHPKIGLPPRHEVFDFTPILRAELGLEDGSTLGPLTPPAGVEPLSDAAFRRRVDGTCRRVLHEANAIFRGHDALFGRIKALGSAVTKSDQGRDEISAYGTRVIEPIGRLVRRGYLELATIAAPPSKAGAYRRYLKMNAKSLEFDLVEARVFELGDVKLPALEARSLEAKTESRQRRALAAKLGIPICESSVGAAGSGAETTPS